jgi:hypothetical protein
MTKISMFAAAAALACAAAAPVAAQDVNPDPFVSTAGPALGLSTGLIVAGVAVVVIAVAAIDSSDDT